MNRDVRRKEGRKVRRNAAVLWYCCKSVWFGVLDRFPTNTRMSGVYVVIMYNV